MSQLYAYFIVMINVYWIVAGVLEYKYAYDWYKYYKEFDGKPVE